MPSAETMRAIAIAHPGGPDALQPVDQPVPRPHAGKVLIRVAAAGVNGPDLAQRRGGYDPPPGASPLPGLEVSGEIVGLGEGVTQWRGGERVIALTNGGGYAEYVSVPEGQVLPLPDGWSLPDGAALPETWFTITQTLVMRAGLAPGMSVLVYGAAGGIGGAAIQIGTILGARVIGLVSSEEKAAYARSLGAVATINYRNEDIVARTLALTDGKGADRIVDIVGGENVARNIEASARGGHIVQVSTLGGGMAAVSVRTMMMKDLTLSGSTLRPQSREAKAAIASRIRADLWAALCSPTLPRPAIRHLPLEAAPEAHRRMEARDSYGKIVLVTRFGQAASGA